MGKIKESQKLMSQLEKHYPDAEFAYFHAHMYALRGEKEEALSIFINNKTRLYARLGMADETILLLKENLEKHRILKEGRFQVYHLPIYNKIRSDSRFQDIVAEYKEIYEENLRKYGDIDL